jgi:hypothetical protein
MNSKHSQLLADRARILEAMSLLDRMERGRLSEQFLKGRKDGKAVLWGPYFVLQRREGKKHVTRRVPAAQAPLIQKDIDGHIRFEELAGQYAQVTEELTRLQDEDPESKKKSKPSNKAGSRKPKPS